ncbi:MAG TPA: DUF3592 domain-containing protein [Terriglobales bacterium]|jgi:hypothetical protein|nr:DUF3592 domain-containing protein [Terriglobales bacterium]
MRLMTRLLYLVFYSYRYIYWALIEFSAIFGKSLRVPGTVELANAQSCDMGLDRIHVRYKYAVRGQTYIGSFTRECTKRNSDVVMRRFPVGRMVSVHVDEDRPNRSYLPSGLGYVGPLFAFVPATALLFFWVWWVHLRIVASQHFMQAQPPDSSQEQPADCPAGLPGTPDAAAAAVSRRDARKGLTPFTSDEGDFSILRPVAPQHSDVRSLPTPYGRVGFTILSAETPDALYEVGYGDVPGEGPIDSSWLASTSSDRLSRSKLIERHDVRLNGVPGNAYTAADDQYYWSERIYFVGRRYYRMSVYIPRSGCTWPSNAAAFLSSLHTTHSKN